jgi:hypothetical protein
MKSAINVSVIKSAALVSVPSGMALLSIRLPKTVAEAIAEVINGAIRSATESPLELSNFKLDEEQLDVVANAAIDHANAFGRALALFAATKTELVRRAASQKKRRAH